MKRASSLFNIFTPENNVEDNLRLVQEDVETIKKACKNATKAFKETLRLRNTTNIETCVQETTYHKSGELMLRKAEMIKHSDSPVKEILTMTGKIFETFGTLQCDFEMRMHEILDTGKMNDLTSKGYAQVEAERNELKRKSSQHTNSRNQFEKEMKKLESAKDDPEYEKELQLRTDKAEADMDALSNEMTSAEDKLAATLYCLQSNESLYAQNILDCVVQIKDYLSKMLVCVDGVLPTMEDILYTTPRRKVFGEDLETHLRTRDVKIAVPLKFAVFGLLNHLHVEGLFRVGPAILCFRRAKNAIDAGIPLVQMRAVFNDPHVLTGLIKGYLRDLKDPLFCSKFAQRWAEANRKEDRDEQVKHIKKILEKLPEANKANIGFLFQFLSKLVAEKEHNLMTTDNLAIVIGPNLLWSPDNGTDSAFSINSVVKTMIEEVTEFFPTDLITECDEESGIFLDNHGPENTSPTYTSRSNSWENWISQERRRYSDENLGAKGTASIFRAVDMQEGEEQISGKEQAGSRVKAQSVEKLGKIKEETFVEKMKDNFEGMAPSVIVRSLSTSKETRRKLSDETGKKGHLRSSSGSSLKDFLGTSSGATSKGFMSSMYSSIRRNKSSGPYEDKMKKKPFN